MSDVKNPLEKWIAAKTGGRNIREYQLEKLSETLCYAYEKSNFYKGLYREADVRAVKSFEDFEKLPFITAKDLTLHGPQMLCVPQHDIERIVTLYTSGTEGEPKRVYFTKSDQELTVDFFHNGIQCLIDEKDNFMILLPYKTPGSVGGLLMEGLCRLGCGLYPYGLIEDYIDAGRFMTENKITSLVGNPVQVLRLAEITRRSRLDIKPDSVLLSTDYVPDALAGRIADIWQCKVYEHYGMTEMCFGGGVFCEHLKGYHMREADLYFEIISEDGRVVSDGEYGEVVFTTLTRTGMPLIRYRTGDYGRFLRERCLCGDTLKLMEKIKRRAGGGIPGKDGRIFYINDFDELIFAVDGITDYGLEYTDGKLIVKVLSINDMAAGSGAAGGAPRDIRGALEKMIRDAAGLDSEITVEADTGAPQEKLTKRRIVAG